MPTATAKKRAQTRKRQRKAASTQAGEFVREEMRKYKSHKGRPQSRKQAIAIGLSEARSKGAKVPRKRTAKKTGGRKKKR